MAPYTQETVVLQPPDQWLTNAHMTHYPTLLLNSDKITFTPLMALNHDNLLDSEAEPQAHNCQQFLAKDDDWGEDLTDQPLSNTQETWFTDGSRFMDNVQWWARQQW